MQKVIIVLFMVSFIGCNNTKKQLESHLQGDWFKMGEIKDSVPRIPPPPSLFQFFGLGFKAYKIELFNGFIGIKYDSAMHRRIIDYKGNFTDYKIENDSIHLLNPFNGKWKSRYKIKKLIDDTLILGINKTLSYKFEKLRYGLDTIPDFDQIILSSSGCFGSCPIINISIDNKNNVLFQGIRHVKKLGLFYSKIDEKSKDFIFTKFEKAKVNLLKNEYSARWTDDETISTTFIKNGKIIKSIRDYGKVSSKELVWAYTPLRYLPSYIELDTFFNKSKCTFPKTIHSFRNSFGILYLKATESFFLLTEIIKAKTVKKQFKPVFEVDFSNASYLWTKKDGVQYGVKQSKMERIISDGEYYKFYFKDSSSCTYDIGYNFITRNFLSNDFKAIKK